MCLAAFIINKRSDELSIAGGFLGGSTQKVDAIEKLILIKSAL